MAKAPTRATRERGKWVELGNKLVQFIAENDKKSKDDKLSRTELFKAFAKKYNTTASSASFYFYNVIRKETKMDKNNVLEVAKEKESPIDVGPVDSSGFLQFTTTTNPRIYHKIGDIIEVKIVAIKDFGAFAQTDVGTEGLIHISAITNEYVTMPDDYFYVGERVKAKIVRFDGDKLALSTKDAGGKSKINNDFKALTGTVLDDIAEYKKEKEKDKENEAVQDLFTEIEIAENTIISDTKTEQIKKVEKMDSSQEKEMHEILEFIKKYSDNNVSKNALISLEDLLLEYGIFKTTVSLMEALRDLDISSFIVNMTRERLEGERLRRISN